MSNPDFSYVNKKGKRVAGTAAFLNYVFTEKGGIQNYNDEIGMAYLKQFIKEHSDIINADITKHAKKKRFKVVG